MIPAVSNIAWPTADDEAAHAMLAAAKVQHIEIAPTRWWPDITQVTETEARKMADQLHLYGLSICAFQALLFGKPDLQVFGTDDGAACLSHLEKVCQLANWVGAKALVLGSPKNRLRGSLTPYEAFGRGVDFFHRLGETSAALGVTVCIEPNPAGYGCDYLQTASEVAAVVQTVNSPGIRMNLDVGEFVMNGSNVRMTVENFLPLAGHFHASQPMLEPFDAGTAAHTEAAEALHAARYQGVLSLEMKAPSGGLPMVADALRDMMATYLKS